MTPTARLAAAIELLAAIEADPRRPADAVANDFFRTRRFIGGADRRAVSDRIWAVLRARLRLGWWLARVGAVPTARLLLAACLMLMQEWTLEALARAYSGGKFAPEKLAPEEAAALRALDGHTITHPDMPASVAQEVPDFVLPLLQARFGDGLEMELVAMAAPAPLDLRVNLLKATREQALAALAAEQVVASATPLSPWGLRVPGRRPITAGRTFQGGLVEIQDEGSQVVAALVGA